MRLAGLGTQAEIDDIARKLDERHSVMCRNRGKKMMPCVYDADGVCNRGEACRFSHGLMGLLWALAQRMSNEGRAIVASEPVANDTGYLKKPCMFMTHREQCRVQCDLKGEYTHDPMALFRVAMVCFQRSDAGYKAVFWKVASKLGIVPPPTVGFAKNISSALPAATPRAPRNLNQRWTPSEAQRGQGRVGSGNFGPAGRGNSGYNPHSKQDAAQNGRPSPLRLANRVGSRRDYSGKRQKPARNANSQQVSEDAESSGVETSANGDSTKQRFGPIELPTTGNGNNGQVATRDGAGGHDRTSSGESRGADGGVAIKEEKAIQDPMDVCEVAPKMEEEDLLL